MPATGYRYLVKLPNVRGGNPVIEGTRIGVHDVVGLIVNGSTVDDVVRSFPDVDTYLRYSRALVNRGCEAT
jgi:uncharacterized protein (DUF433 family)